MTEKGKYSSFSTLDGKPIHWPDQIRFPEPVADIHIVRLRRGYIFELDGQLMDDGTTRPTREPRVATIMAAYLKFGAAQPFTLREAVSATYDAGRHKSSWTRKFWKDVTTPKELKDMITSDHWILANTSDTLSCATRCHLKIVLLGATISLEKLSHGVYMFHLNPPAVEAYPSHPLLTHEEFCNKYRAKFEREGIK